MHRTRPARPQHEPALRVAVVGGGAAGVITAAHLLRQADEKHPVDVRLIERATVVGPGLAYSHDHPRLTVNNYAGRLSALADEPDHLVTWFARRGQTITPTDFPTRADYGHYLSSLIDDIRVPAGCALGRVRGTAIDVVEHDQGLRVVLPAGWSVDADVVVLALGTPPPRSHALARAHRNLVGDPWCDDLEERVAGARDILLLGTGLTMVDTVARLQEAAPMARFTAVSRTGRLPATHRRAAMPVHRTIEPVLGSLDAAVAQVEEHVARARAGGGDWRDVLDSLRAAANTVWQSWPAEDQRRFVGQTARQWERLRHRMSPDMADFVGAMQRSARLRVATMQGLNPTAYDVVVNCTGPAPTPTRGWNRLVDRLLDRGTIRANGLGLGLDLDADGHVVGTGGAANPQIYAVGAARRGLEWEVGAIPDLRTQAAALARGLLGARRVGHEVGADTA